MAATDAKPLPQKNVAYRHYFAIRKNDGTLITSWAGNDSERSLDGASFADCTNEATEIGTTGCGYIDLTSTEMNTDATILKVTVTNTDALPYVVTLFPEEAGDIRADVVAISGDSSAADNLESACDNYTATRGLSGTALPNAAADAAGGLPISDAGGLDMDSIGGAANVLLSSEIDTVSSQTEFALVDGASHDNAYNGQAIVLYDDSNSDFPSVRTVSDYVGSTKTITLSTAPDFTLGTDDSVRIFTTAPGTTAPTTGEIVTAIDADSTKLTAILDDTNELQTDNVPALIAALENVSQAEVQTAANAALVALHLDHLLAVAESDTPVDNSIIAKLASKTGDWSTYAEATDSLQGIREEGDVSWNTTAPDPMRLLASEINTVASQTSFTLVDGADFDDAYNGQTVVLYDDSNNDYTSVRVITDYTGSTKTVTLDSAPDFTLGTDDSVDIFATAPGSTAPTTGQIVTAMDNTSAKFATLVTNTSLVYNDWINGGRLDLLLDSVITLATAIKTKTDTLAFTSGLVQAVMHDATSAGLAKFATVDTGETTVTEGSVAALSQGDGGGAGVGQYQIPVTVLRSSDSLPVVGAIVSIVGTSVYAVTGVSGSVILNAENGTYLIRVTPPTGYTAVADVSKTVADDDVAAFNVVLSESTVASTGGLFQKLATATDWTLSFAIGDLSGTDWEELRFTCKSNAIDQTDAEAEIQIKVSRVASETDGLLILNGATADDLEYGEIEITNAATGTGVVRVFAGATELIAPTHQRLWTADSRVLAANLYQREQTGEPVPLLHWDVKRLDGDGMASPVRQVGYIVATEAITQHVVE
jgi:hypothetical protein